jgi:Domain of unknown function (DUF4157)/Acetyltransferase (GNAT) domain
MALALESDRLYDLLRQTTIAIALQNLGIHSQFIAAARENRMKQQHLNPTQKATIAPSQSQTAIAQRLQGGIAQHFPHPIEQLQSAIGNRAVNRLLANQPTVQAKPLFRGWSHEFTQNLQQSSERLPDVSGGGKTMPEAIKQKMETAFGKDFSDVRIHEGKEAESIGAIAYTRGRDIHFAPGQYNPISQKGQELLGHELAHVVQQQAGQVAMPQGKGVPINADRRLENEADVLGTKVAQGDRVQVAGSETRLGHSVALDTGEVVQCQGFKEKVHKLVYEKTRGLRRNLGEKSKGVIELGKAGRKGGEDYRSSHRNGNTVNIIDPLDLISSQIPEERNLSDTSNSPITPDYKIKFLVSKISVEDAKNTLKVWDDDIQRISNTEDLDNEIKLRFEASRRILKSMLEVLDDNQTYGSLQVWKAAIATHLSEDNTQAIALVSLYGSETVVNYLATAPSNIYGAEDKKVRGAGTSLMVAAIRKAKEDKSPVTLHADANAVPFYQNMGFQGIKEVGEDWEMKLTLDRFDRAEAYLKEKNIGLEAPEILKALKKFDRDFWNNL